ncbi:MAG: PRC-barrel domain-containing protein [Candidatus Bathyarchaeota archaeon]|nr:PRC-barrel domain-containing protein [Candidatus Bathyarchaeota archaeon]
MKCSELIDKIVYAEGHFNVGKVKDIVVDAEEWKVTHLEIELSKEASEQILGVKPAMFGSARNTLAISALEKGGACCSASGIDLKVSKGQLAIYLRPV